MQLNDIILVDSLNQETGFSTKDEVHRLGLLHRAFSVLIFDNQGRMLIQRRALSKYHTPGLWTNACCSHPRPEESTIGAAHRRLKEELGFDTELFSIGTIIYRHEFGNGLTEHEFDEVFIGRFSDIVDFDTSEVDSVRRMSLSEIRSEVEAAPQDFTIWFKLILQQFQQELDLSSIDRNGL